MSEWSATGLHRTCRVCGEEKPLDSAHFMMKQDWFLRACRTCENARVQRREAEAREAARALLPRCDACETPAVRIFARGVFCEAHEPTLCLCEIPALSPRPRSLRECRHCHRLATQ